MSVKSSSSFNSNTNQKSAKKNIRFEHSLIRDIEDSCPEGTSFSSWVKRACRDRCTVDNMIAQSSNPPSRVYVALIVTLYMRGYDAQQIAWKLNCIGISSTDGTKWGRGDIEAIMMALR
ncbi:hypothetical protein R3X26_17345 [Vibrio sp. TH_r3]|uniref:hypothetical protein n=1 Tax=Vibrio sp. TH_r3 TaxID=3082084 RepID=UPI0029559CCD|nr:hypothetical protein [Vibrio sp. TH_r3]MDV7106165.1 hypothetical protein [Vibrio sp. TH_r3]